MDERAKLEAFIAEKKEKYDKLDYELYELDSQIEEANLKLLELDKQDVLKQLEEAQTYINAQDSTFNWSIYDITFTKEEVAKINLFIAQTESRYSGAIGGRYTFTITPTSLGDLITLSDGEREETIRGL